MKPVTSLALMTTLMSPLLAQPAPLLRPQPDVASVQIMSAFAHCAAESDPRRAAQIVEAGYHTDAYRMAIRRFADEQKGCLPHSGKLVFQPVLFAGGMAESLMRKRGVDLAAVDLSRATPNPNGPLVCVVRNQQGAVAKLLATKPATAEEADALAALKPALANCLSQQQTLVTNPVGMRAMLALAGYRLTSEN